MGNHFHKTSDAKEAQFRKDVHVVLDEAGGPLTEDEILDRVRCRELQRTVDSPAEGGMLIEIVEGHYFPAKKGREWAGRAKRGRDLYGTEIVDALAGRCDAWPDAPVPAKPKAAWCRKRWPITESAANPP